ncbi:DUF4859 domain-containing protein [Bacteroides reticulotermitis]|uniref:DUF4859 domain-containing protein n=1 Tax=Bacteroides reticulotermitis TaxID=1133319 RepID=UPI003A8C6123
MKKNLIYTLIGCFMLAFAACDDIEDATSKHVYGENENPYLKVNAAATVTTSLKFPVARFEPQTLNLKDYAAKFHDYLGMTVDEAVSALADGSVVFYNINSSKGSWNKAAMTKGTTGWYYNTAGGVSEKENAIASLELDKDAKTLVVSMIDGAPVGTSLNLNVGFALNGPDYDNYVRFSFTVTVTDPGRIIVTDNIPTGDYASFQIDFADHENVIVENLGMTLKEFTAACKDSEGDIALYMVDNTTGAWDKENAYTAGGSGISYWLDANCKVTTWNTAGFTLFVETSDDGSFVAIGRAPAIASGTKINIRFVYASKSDDSKFIEFIVNATFD